LLFLRDPPEHRNRSDFLSAALDIFNRPQKEIKIWRVLQRNQLDKLIKHKNIVNHIKAQKLSWFGYVQRMPDTRTVKMIFKWNPLPKRSQGRPKYRREDKVK